MPLTGVAIAVLLVRDPHLSIQAAGK